MPIDLSMIKKKLNPPPDGQDVLRLKVGVVAAIDADGTVDLTLNGTTVTNVPCLGSAQFAVGQTVQVLSYRGSLLVLGGSGAPAAQAVSATGGNGDTGTTTNTSFITALSGGTASWGVAFIAPPSGRVLVTCKAAAFNNTANSYAVLDFQVRLGSTVNAGTIFRNVSEDTAGVIRSGVANQQCTIVASDVISGLTPGAVYNVTLGYHAAVSGTASFNRRQAIVIPQ
jgi:hypothetical protein